MRLKLIAGLSVLVLLAMMSALALAQEGGKPLPGEGTPTATQDAPIEASATPTEAADNPTEIPETPTEEASTEDDAEFPADMLEETGLDFEDATLALYETFDEDDAWETGNFEAGSLSIDDGVYIIENINYQGVLWGQNLTVHSDVVIQVTTEQLSDEDNNGFGIMCRAAEENNLDGYHLWISGDGYVTIVVHEDEEFETLVEWETTDTINQGQDTNVITAVCVGEYIALFVNGELVAETEDDTFDEGVAGLSNVIFEEDENVEIAFDDLYIWTIGDAGSSSEANDELDPEAAEEDVANALEDGDVEIELRGLAFSENFDEQGAWGVLDNDGSIIDVLDGAIFFEEPSEQLFTWSQNFDLEDFDDVVIRIDTEHLSDSDEAASGVMCRIEPDNDELNAYSFLVGADGYYAIGIWEDNSFDTLVDGTDSAINEGQAVNQIYAVCVGEYLALYVNGALLDEVDDDTFEEGRIGVGVISYSDEPVTATFDNLYVWDARD